jgi:hypothetical protein
MLALHRSPANKDRKTPKLVSSHQTVLERTGVDSNSRWRVDWEGVGQADISCEMEVLGLRNGAVTIFCEEGDLVVDCGYSGRRKGGTNAQSPRGSLMVSGSTLILMFTASSLAP